MQAFSKIMSSGIIQAQIFNKNMFVDALIQYDPVTKLLNSNVRFNLIHHPLSDLFIVWNEQRFETGEGIVPGRSLTIKLTQMVAF